MAKKVSKRTARTAAPLPESKPKTKSFRDVLSGIQEGEGKLVMVPMFVQRHGARIGHTNPDGSHHAFEPGDLSATLQDAPKWAMKFSV